MADDLPDFEGWQTVEKLGEGGMCVVYRVRSRRDPSEERAIKVLTDTTKEARLRFAEEGRLLLDIEHANVLKVFEISADAEPPWLAMELLTGRDLEFTLNSEAQMDPERAVSWFADLASGLAAVHARGVRHRDIKPANVMRGADGVPKLIDFGIARDTAVAGQTRAGFVVGTASYLAPEVYLDEDTEAARNAEAADVYALGQSLFEVLCGRPVHARDSDHPNVLVHIMRDKIERPFLDPREWRPQVPASLAELVKRATAREPEDRFPDALALEQALRDWLGERRQGLQAPVTRLSVAELPSVPHSVTSAAPASRGSWLGRVVAALGVLLTGTGFASALAGVLAVLVVGLAGLWMLRPLQADRRLLEAMSAQAAGLDACGAEGRWTLRLSVRGGLVAGVKARGPSGAPVEVERCLTARAADLTWPSRLVDGVQEIPLRFTEAGE